MSETLRAGVIGLGGISGQHISNYRKAEGVQLVAGADISEELAKSVSHKYGFKGYTDWKKMLEEESLYMSCLNCGSQWMMKPKEAGRYIVCHVCGGQMIAALSGYNREAIRLLRKKDLSEDEEKEVRRLFKNASLVQSNGKRAMLAFAGRGIGADTAARILSGFGDGEEGLLRDILNAEINYARTKRFWD